MKHLSVFRFLMITVGLAIAVPVPRADAASPLDKLQDRLFGDRDDRKDKNKDKDKDKDKDRRRDDERYRDDDRRAHECFDGDRNGYCDSCRTAVAVSTVRAHQCYDRDRSGHCDFCGKGLAGIRPVLQPHQCYDRDHSGYCDYCGRLFVAARGGAVYEGRSRDDDRYDVDVGSRRYTPARSVEAEVQAALMRRGYYGGPADGSVGPGSRKAIEKFQDDYKLDVTGRIDSALLRALKIDTR